MAYLLTGAIALFYGEIVYLATKQLIMFIRAIKAH